MHVDEAIRSRRTLKEFTDEPVAPELVRELLELAVLAPNHHGTEPWRFWVVGRDTLNALSPNLKAFSSRERPLADSSNSQSRPVAA